MLLTTLNLIICFVTMMFFLYAKASLYDAKMTMRKYKSENFIKNLDNVADKAANHYGLSSDYLVGVYRDIKEELYVNPQGNIVDYINREYEEGYRPIAMYILGCIVGHLISDNMIKG